MLSLHRFFPIVLIAVVILAWCDPAPLSALENASLPILTIALFCISLHLRTQDAKRLVHNPKALLVGIVLQWAIIPGWAWLLTWALSSPALGHSLILLSLCSNALLAILLTYIARGDLALACALALINGLLAIFITPYLFSEMLSVHAPLSAQDVTQFLALYAVLPILGGAFCARFIPAIGKSLVSHMPNLICAAVLLLIGIAVSRYSVHAQAFSYELLIALILFACGSLGLGYGLARLCRCTTAQARTLSLSVALPHPQPETLLAIHSYDLRLAPIVPTLAMLQDTMGSVMAGIWRSWINRMIKGTH